jgi:hypothetical protein
MSDDRVYTADDLFDENGDLATWVISKMNSQGYLDGVEADAYLAFVYSNETHENYCAETLFSRAEFSTDNNIHIERKSHHE